MEQIYIAMIDTPGLFATLIRRVLKQKYIHVAIGIDSRLDEAYSIGRRNPVIPFFAGFEREDKEKVLAAFPTAYYRICVLECSEAQKRKIMDRLRQDYKKRWKFHYAVLGLPLILWNIPFCWNHHYTCSSYIARVLEENGICVCEKHFSLVTPKDFCLYEKLRTVYEGSLAEFVEKEKTVEYTQAAARERYLIASSLP